MGAHQFRRGFTLAPRMTTASYTTNFPNTENPLSESGIWICGGVLTNRSNCASTPGKGFGKQVAITAPPFTDSRAIIDPAKIAFSPDVYVKTIVSSSSPTGEHELEILHRFKFTLPDQTFGYALDWVFNSGNLFAGSENGTSGGNQQFTQWNTSGFPFAVGTPANGDTIESQMKGNFWLVKINGTQIFNIDITTMPGPVYSNGQPGFGFYTDLTFGAPSTGDTLCYSHWEGRDV